MLGFSLEIGSVENGKSVDQVVMVCWIVRI